MTRLRSYPWVFLAVLAVSGGSPAVQACTACFGKSDSNMAQGMNMGIFALLLVITSVLCGVAGFFVYLARRSSQLEQAPLTSSLSENRTNA
jgi:hypothetical protein